MHELRYRTVHWLPVSRVREIQPDLTQSAQCQTDALILCQGSAKLELGGVGRL
jgi:hypothetical protein